MNLVCRIMDFNSCTQSLHYNFFLDCSSFIRYILNVWMLWTNIFIKPDADSLAIAFGNGLEALFGAE